jgi:hypothetical protein
LKKTLEKQGSLYVFNMNSSALLDRATIRHNRTEFKVRWLAHIEEWKAENRPAIESSHDQN